MPGAIIAIIEFFRVFGPLLSKLVSGVIFLIDFTVDWFALRTKRLRDQVDNEKEARRLAQEAQKIKEDANVAAFKSIVEESWMIRYNQIVEKIKEKDYASVLKMIDIYDNEAVNLILFDLSQSPEYRAMQVIRRMKEGSINHK
jgi:hypothetical protein